MAEQSSAQRQEGWADFMRTIPPGSAYSTTKQNLRAAYDALDTWFSDNAATLNQAIPQPARGEMSTTEKARLAIQVIRDRYLKGVT